MAVTPALLVSAIITINTGVNAITPSTDVSGKNNLHIGGHWQRNLIPPPPPLALVICGSVKFTNPPPRQVGGHGRVTTLTGAQ